MALSHYDCQDGTEALVKMPCDFLYLRYVFSRYSLRLCRVGLDGVHVSEMACLAIKLSCPAEQFKGGQAETKLNEKACVSIIVFSDSC